MAEEDTDNRAERPPSNVFVIHALETINASKDARKNKDLGDATQAALQHIRNTEQKLNPELLFRPLQLASRSHDVQTQVTALDCIGKLISYSYFAFSEPSADSNTPSLIERAIEAICDCFENEGTPVEIQQQIIKSLLAAILDDKIVVHGAGLLKAVRQIYNIFIYSKNTQNQQIAQGSLTQMVASVFQRCTRRLETANLRTSRSNTAAMSSNLELPGANSEVTTPNGLDDENKQLGDDGVASTNGDVEPPELPKLTLQDFEKTNGEEPSLADGMPTTVTRARKDTVRTNGSISLERNNSVHENDPTAALTQEDEDEIYLRDAFLVFRSLCKLSQKQLSHEQQQEIRSQSMRSKLLSLHLIHYVLNNYISVFISPQSVLRTETEPLQFVQIAKPHLCLSLSRNAASSVSKVYEVCCEIFWLSMKHLRVAMKKEIEVFWKEIYLAVLEKKSAPLFQKQLFIDVLQQLSGDARALVEIYLNYDCDRTALDNMYQEIVEHLSRICSTPITVSVGQQQLYQEQNGRTATIPPSWHAKGSLVPTLTTASLHKELKILEPSPIPPDYSLKQQSLRCLLDILDSLDNWCSASTSISSPYAASRMSKDEARDSIDQPPGALPSSPRVFSSSSDIAPGTSVLDDDPNEMERVKKRKIALNEAIRQFNFKPKKGVKALIEQGFIRSSEPAEVAQFLLTNDKLDKAMLGEYMGEGDEYNVSVMHAFVDTMEFSKRRFVDALRQFLQSFRLPGEAQKIDRFMLKFAERYLTGNPNAFANADTAYVLGYSVIMLNTDQHSSKMKGKRMTPEDFIKNNRGINDGQDLPPEYLTSIYEEIANNEIVLTSEREHAEDQGIQTAPTAAGVVARTQQAIINAGRDLQAEKQAAEADKMANRTEQLFRTLVRAQKKSTMRDALSRFVPAQSTRHVGAMFNQTWMSFLSALSSQMQDTQNLELIQQCLNGLRMAIRITCRFDLDTARTAFVTALAKSTNLGNVKEMTAKNVQALRVLIDVATTEGDLLKGAWREILMCVSQLDRLQLLSTGVDESALPDMNRASLSAPATSKDAKRRSTQLRRLPPRSANSFRPEIADETKSTDMVRNVDQIFTNTAKLSLSGMIDFVRALTEVSWQEIQSSGSSESPRMYSLQKLVEISYYNMTRVRIEWSRIWDVLGDHFNLVGCHNNTAVVFFALDSLRQLSMRFMELDELAGFKFQKDFLKPFEYIMTNNPTVTVKDMVLRCIIQMIQAKGDNIRSGWRTMFGVFQAAAMEQYETVVSIAFEYTTQVYESRFGVIITQGAFPDLISCLKQFTMSRYQKKSLQALDLLKSTIPKMLKTPECPLSKKHKPKSPFTNGSIEEPEENIALSRISTAVSPEEQYWFPVLLAYQSISMTGSDLEVRSKALNYLFEAVTRHGGDFSKSFWETLWHEVLYPIFLVLQSKSEMQKAPNHEELSVWLSTTMIQALRNMISLFTHYFEGLEHMLDRFLELLTLCICQENDTIARIGSNCLQQLILQNVNRFDIDHWDKIVGAFVDLFERTTAYALFEQREDSKNVSMNGRSRATSTATTAVHTDQGDRDVPNGTTEGQEDAHVRKGSISALSISEEPSSNQETDTKQTQIAGTEAKPDSIESFAPTTTPQPIVSPAKRRHFNKIITSCVLHLLMIETVSELFSNDAVYASIPPSALLRLMGVLKKSYQFAKTFNADKELRMSLWRQGFMKQPPNLLKQESGSAGSYVGILMRMYSDPGKMAGPAVKSDEEGQERPSEEQVSRTESDQTITRSFSGHTRDDVEAALIPLCLEIIKSFVSLEPEQGRNIAAWKPVVVDVLEGFSTMPPECYQKYRRDFSRVVVELLRPDREAGLALSKDLQSAVYGFYKRGVEVDR